MKKIQPPPLSKVRPCRGSDHIMKVFSIKCCHLCLFSQLLLGIRTVNITMISNSTINFIERIKEERHLWFEHFSVAAMTLLLIVSNLIALSLIKLINTRDQRLIDKLIKFQTIVMNFISK